MIRSTILTLATLLPLLAAGSAGATAPPASDMTGATDPAITPPMAAPTDSNPVASALRSKLNALPTDGSAQELKERAVLSDFYAARRDAPMWLSEAGLTDGGAALGAEILNAGDWGLEAKDFALPAIPPASQLDAEKIGKADVEISLALLKYARYARGGRIIEPSILLNSNLDRKPQLIDPEIVIKGAAEATDAGAYVRSLHPKQPQFEKLRQAYLANKGKPLARKILANMEEWRWMPDDLGAMHIMANVPEFMVYLVKDNARIHTERIVVGETGKQTTIFSRPLKTIVFKPMWRVPDRIKAHELQPNLRRGGSMFRQYDLELQTKDGQTLDYRTDQLERRQHPRLRGGAAARPQERDGARQVHVPEPAHHLHARHDRQVDVRQRRAHAEPRLPAAAQPDEDGRAGAGRGQGLGRRQDHRDDAVLARQHHRHRQEDPHAPRLLHRLGRR